MAKFSSAQRVLRILFLLKGHSLHGLSNGEIADGLDESPANVSRALSTLTDEGFAVRLDSGRYAPSIKVAQLGVAHLNELDAAQQRINELRQRTMAGAMG